MKIKGLLAPTLCLLLKQIEIAWAQVFLRDCNDPIIVGHDGRYQHSYCFHACGGLVATNLGVATCAAGGVCACPCSATGPTSQFSPDICPPFASDPADPDPTALPRCMATCAARCPGGTGQICGEVETLTAPGGANAYAKICTCICPPSSCTPTTTTVAPTTQVSIIPILIKPIVLKKVKYWLVKGVLYNLIFFGTILKLIIIKVGFLSFLAIAYFVFHYIQLYLQEMMYSYVDGFVRMGQYLVSFMQ